MIGLCDNCALKYADCKGDKDLEKTRCDYYKKPIVMNVKELAERVAELEIELKRYQWIPVSERLPADGETVLASWKWLWDGAIVFAQLEDGMWSWAYEQGTNYWEEEETEPDAWMPMPEPYKDAPTVVEGSE